MTFDQILDAIVQKLNEQVAGLGTCSRIEKPFSISEVTYQVPALFTGMLAFSREPDRGTEEIRLKVSWLTWAIANDSKGSGLSLAQSTAEIIQGNRWGLDLVEVAELEIGELQDSGDPTLTLWKVPWTQIVTLGTNVFDASGSIITDPKFSWVPEVGTAHEPDYKPLGG
jgi:hypothetical protein